VKEFLKNPLRTGKIIAMSLVYYFFGTQCIMETCDFLLFFVMSCVTRSSICCIFKILAAGVLFVAKLTLKGLPLKVTRNNVVS